MLYAVFCAYERINTMGSNDKVNFGYLWDSFLISRVNSCGSLRSNGLEGINVVESCHLNNMKEQLHELHIAYIIKC